MTVNARTMIRPPLTATLALGLIVAGCGNEVRLGGTRTGSGLDTDPLRPADTTPPVAECEASPAIITPGTAADFLAEASYDPDGIPIIDHRWELLTAPTGSKARLPAGEVNRAGFLPDLAGTYVARLIVTNDRGSTSAHCDATLSVRPDEALWVEAIPKWDDDVQVVVARGSTINADFDTADICVAGSCNVDWGDTNNAVDDPRVLSDDLLDGVEVVAIEAPASGPYLIGVSDGPGEVLLGANEVVVRVFAFGDLASEISVDLTGERETPTPLFRIKFPEGSVGNL